VIITRRLFTSGLITLIAAPAIVRATSIMPVKSIILPHDWPIYGQVLTYDIADVGHRIATDYRDAVKASGIDEVDARWKRLVERQRSIIERGAVNV